MAFTRFTAHELLAERQISLKEIAPLLLAPPAWTRLEPQSLSGEPEAGVEMRIADALWMLGRQWQMGEFRGEDCGTPVSVRMEARSRPLSALRPGGPEGPTPPEPLQPGRVFEPRIEAAGSALPALRDRAEAGAALVAALGPLGWSGEAQLLEDCAFDLDALGLQASGPDAAWRLIARHHPDGEAAAVALEAGSPDWLQGEPEDVRDAAADWLGWYRRNVSPPPQQASSWHPDRLEYRFALQAGTGNDARTLVAPCHLGGPVDWFSFDLGAGRGLGLDGDGDGERRHETHVHASRLRYVGMPAPRLWQFEDGLVNLGVTDVQSNALARLVFLEYATIYGTDWLIAPIDLPRGSLVEITSVSYRTTFGEEVVVKAADDRLASERFRLYRTDGPDGAEAAFILPPNGRAPLHGDAREEVVFARDETANLVWAIERSFEGADGLARDRSAETPPLAPPAPLQPGAHDAWTLEIRPPEHWIPMVPIPTDRQGGFILRKGSFDGTDHARGRLLAPTPFNLEDEEVPREGIRVRRIPAVLRDEDGSLHRWTTFRVTAAWGESRSRLEYDRTAPSA